MAKKEDMPVLAINLVETTPVNLVQSLVYTGKDKVLAEIAMNNGKIKYDGKVCAPGSSVILERGEENAKVLEVDGNQYKVFCPKK